MEAKMNKTKILFVIESLAGGGAEKVLSVILKYINKNKYEITLCSIVNTGVYLTEVQYYINHYHSLVSYKGNWINKIWNKIKYKLIYSILPCSIVYKLFIPKGNDIEIAFCEGFTTKLLSYGKANIKRIAWVHIDLKYLPWTQTNQIFKSIHEEANTYNTYNNIICVSKTVEKSFNEIYNIPQKTRVIYNPIDIEDIIRKAKHAKPIISRKTIELISIGRLTYQKGYDILFEVIKQIKVEFPIHLTIIGEGEDRLKLEKYIHNNSLDNEITLLGFCNNPYPYLASSDVFICSSRAEGYSLVVAEALCLGIPILSTYCSGPNELLKEGKYGLLTDISYEGLYYGIKYLLKHVELQKALSIQSKLRAQDFNILKTISEIESILE